MKDNAEHFSISEQKDKIRARYKGISKDEIDVMPAKQFESIFKDKGAKRVAVYARVSTDNLRQTSSYELQKNYYTETVARNPNWELVEIYADEGISGTSLQHRDAFIRMIQDCRDGKIDLILTKSVSRFSRNQLDCIGYMRELKALRPSVGIYIEEQGIFSLDPDSELGLSVFSIFAQEESHTKSKSMNLSIDMRFSNGIFLTPALLGYDNDEDGNLVINTEEAKIIRLIFFMYLYGYTCRRIAETLTALGHRTKKQNTEWSPGSILQILQNERHCGDVIARKTWTPSYLDHKSRKNKQDKAQYYHKDHHEAIISRDDFIAVQHLISNAKYGNKGILPELQVIPDGALKGFVSIHPKWAGFGAEDYIRASRSIYESGIPADDIAIEAQSGDFDLRGYEIARSQFFDMVGKASITFSVDEFKFGAECIRKMKDTASVELLIHPDEHLLAVRPAKESNRNAMRWTALRETEFKPRVISGAAFLKTIYEIFGWQQDCRYRVCGIRKQNIDETVLVFDMRETEIFIPNDLMASDFSGGQVISNMEPIVTTPKTVCAYPCEWATNFGSDYYRHAQARELMSFARTGDWNTQSEGHIYTESSLDITGEEELKVYIAQNIGDIEQKEA